MSNTTTTTKVSHELARRITQARQAKGMTQKELATRINEKALVVNEYECAKATCSEPIVAKLQRALGVHLSGPMAGLPLQNALA